MDRIEIIQLSELDAAFGRLGGSVGPRIGADKRTQDAKEWFVLRRCMGTALATGVFDLPIKIAKAEPPEPDFAAIHGRTHKPALIEITEATHPDDQREMTEFARRGKNAILLGDFGGRFAGGASQPKFVWASEICDAVLRKQTKSICTRPAPDRHLVVYPNSNASQLIFDEEDEREAFAHLKEKIDQEHARYAEALNGCRVHILGSRLVCLDLARGCRLEPRIGRKPR